MTNFIFKQLWHHYYCKGYYNRDFITVCALIWFESFFPLILMGYKMGIYIHFHFYWQWFLKRTKSSLQPDFPNKVPTGAKENRYLDIRFCECCNCSVFIFLITKVQMLYAPYLYLLTWIPVRRAWEPPSPFRDCQCTHVCTPGQPGSAAL